MTTEKQTLTANATTAMTVGNKTMHESVIVRYSCKRGSNFQAGKVILTNLASSVDVDYQVTGNDIGLTFTGTFSGNNILLNGVLDNSASDVIFNYRIETINL